MQFETLITNEIKTVNFLKKYVKLNLYNFCNK